MSVAGSAFAYQTGKQHIDQRKGAQIVQNMEKPHVNQQKTPQFPGEKGYSSADKGVND